MRLIIAGSRGITDYDILVKVMSELPFTPTTIVSGTARGVDKLGEEYAEKNDIDIIRYPAEWDKFGKSAGYKRNAIMANNADALLALWDGQSKGAAHMIELAHKKGLKIYIWYSNK